MDRFPKGIIRTFAIEDSCPSELERFWDVIGYLPVVRERYTQVVSRPVAETIFIMEEEFHWVDILQATYFVAGESLRLAADVQEEAFKNIPKDCKKRKPSLMALRAYPNLRDPEPPILPAFFIFFLADEEFDRSLTPLLVDGKPLSRDILKALTEECHELYKQHDVKHKGQPLRTRSPSPSPGPSLHADTSDCGAEKPAGMEE